MVHERRLLSQNRIICVPFNKIARSRDLEGKSEAGDGKKVDSKEHKRGVV
jgi:hypothetical protein